SAQAGDAISMPTTSSAASLATASGCGERAALLVEERDAIVAQQSGDLALPVADRGVDAPSPIRLVGADAHGDVIVHARRSCLVGERRQVELQLPGLDVV